MTKPIPVAEMTLEELERKRASDRINQRYSRARRNKRVAELETRNQTLAAELKEAQERFVRLQRSHEALRNAVNQARALLSPDRAQDSGLSTSGQTYPPIEDTTSPAFLSERSTPGNPDIVVNSAANAPEVGQTLVPTSAVPTVLSSVSRASSQTPGQPLQMSTFFTLESSNNSIANVPLNFGAGMIVNMMNLAGETSVPGFLQWPPSDDFTHDSSVSWAPWFDAGHATFTIQPNLDSALSPLQSEDVPLWGCLPPHLPPTNAVDQMLIDVSQYGRRLRRQRGEQYKELSQKNFPSISSLLISSTEDTAANPISAAVGKHTTWGTSIVSFASRIAYYYLVAHYLRWLVCQNEETFNQLPDFLKPTEMQRTVPHPAWIDLFPWSKERDLLIQYMDFDKFETFRRTTATFAINWPYKDADMFLSDLVDNNFVLNPVFERHIRDSKNWTFGPEVVAAFPFLKQD